jgi:hypothetical protein
MRIFFCFISYLNSSFLEEQNILLKNLSVIYFLFCNENEITNENRIKFLFFELKLENIILITVK